MTGSILPRIDGARLMDRLTSLARIGCRASGGITRLALTREDWEARSIFATWLEESGLSVSSDAAGNLFGRLEGEDPSLPPLLIGSHLDTVPEGGAFDGALGCVAALEVTATIVEAGIRPRRSLEVAVWTDEEGARFGTGLLGSRAFCGLSSPGDLALRDADGTSLAEALEERQLDPAALLTMSPRPVTAYLELHIEQGPILESMGVPLGIVTGIVGMIHLHVEVTGTAGHAGTTPMTARGDALAAASEMVLAVERAAREVGPHTVATVGQLLVSPGAANVIPGRCTFSVDIRSLEEAARDRVHDRIRTAVEEIAERRAIAANLRETLRLPPVPMSERLQEALTSACERENLPIHRLPSGAGHDAMILAGIAEAGMLFTRCRGGVSHNPAESILQEDAAAGAQVLLDAALVELGGEFSRK